MLVPAVVFTGAHSYLLYMYGRLGEFLAEKLLDVASFSMKPDVFAQRHARQVLYLVVQNISVDMVDYVAAWDFSVVCFVAPTMDGTGFALAGKRAKVAFADYVK
jgi:hypothetical protein